MKLFTPLRLVLVPNKPYCEACFKLAKHVLFDLGCNMCKVAQYFEHTNRKKTALGKKKCADCGGRKVDKLGFKAWSDKMATLKKLGKRDRYDEYWTNCHQKAPERMRRLDRTVRTIRRNRANMRGSSDSDSDE